VKRISLISMIITAIFTLGGCGSKEMKLNENYTKIIDTFWKPSYGRNIDLYERHICVNNDNTIEIYGVFNGEKIEGITVAITEKNKMKIINNINENEFWLIPENIENNVCDGSYYGITFFGENGEVIKTCYGLQPSNKKFLNIHNYIDKFISKKDKKEATELIEAKIIEKVNRY
jgi:hypothetical protein